MPDFLDRLGDELVRAARAPVTQPAAAPAPSPPARRLRGPGRGRPRRLFVLLALLIAGASAGAVATLERHTAGPVPPGAGGPLVSAPDAADRASFAILRRAPGEADQIPPQIPVGLSGASGANLGEARRAAGMPQGSVWVVPGRGTVCVLASLPAAHAGGATCARDAQAAEGQLYVESGSAQAPGVEVLAGLVPDGVTSVALSLAHGGSMTVTVHENAYLAAIPGGAGAITFTGARGIVRVDVPPLPATLPRG